MFFSAADQMATVQSADMHDERIAKVHLYSSHPAAILRTFYLSILGLLSFLHFPLIVFSPRRAVIPQDGMMH
jgi:hypothetical protein